MLGWHFTIGEGPSEWVGYQEWVCGAQPIGPIGPGFFVWGDAPQAPSIMSRLSSEETEEGTSGIALPLALGLGGLFQTGGTQGCGAGKLPGGGRLARAVAEAPQGGVPRGGVAAQTATPPPRAMAM